MIEFRHIQESVGEIMEIRKFMKQDGEKPLDNIVSNGGFCGIFRTIACVGDSLSSGEMESMMNGEKGYHDYFEYSWGQLLARDAGCKVYNFSRGGMTAKEYYTSFAEENCFWDEEYKSQAYIIALGVNDVTRALMNEDELGDTDDIERENDTFASYYMRIIKKYKELQPKAEFFLMTVPRDTQDEARNELYDKHGELLYAIAGKLDNCYILDFRKYAPEYDEEFKRNFYLGGHLNAMGYRLTALMVESYIDYIIRNNPEDFKQVGFIGTEYYNETEKL